MAYMGQDRKAELAEGIKAVLRKYGMKGSVGVRNHSTLVVNVWEGALDILGNANAVCRELGFDHVHEKYIQVNEYCIGRSYTGAPREFLLELYRACMVGNHDRSDTQSDYFDVGWYVNINIGRWDRPYRLVAQKVAA